MEKKGTVLGLDISTSTIGVTLMYDDGTLEDMWYIKPPKTNKKNGEVDMYDKIDYVGEVFNNLKTMGYVFKYVFIEEPLKNGPNINTTILLATFNGMLSQKIKEIFNTKPIHISVHEARLLFFPEYIKTNIVKGVLKETLSFPQGLDKKKVVFDKVTYFEPYFEWVRRKDLSLKTENYDMADSYVVAKSGLMKLGLIKKI